MTVEIEMHRLAGVRGDRDYVTIRGANPGTARLLEGEGVCQDHSITARRNFHDEPTVRRKRDFPLVPQAEEGPIPKVPGRFADVPEINRTILATARQGPA